ncbi:MAG: hypothetical protein IPJ97_11370 [Proteobacteria bacterium]|nr:hypothetical protein [Pseudomonadota bacterium]
MLVDLLMPGIDGFEFCRRVRARPDLADLPLMLLTAMASMEVSAAGAQCGSQQHHGESHLTARRCSSVLRACRTGCVVGLGLGSKGNDSAD